MKVGESSLLTWSRNWARHGAAPVAAVGGAIGLRWEAMLMSLLFAVPGMVVGDADDTLRNIAAPLNIGIL